MKRHARALLTVLVVSALPACSLGGLTGGARDAAADASSHDASVDAVADAGVADVAPLPSLFTQLTPASLNGTWGIEAPDDADQAAFAASDGGLGAAGSRGYFEKGYGPGPTLLGPGGSTLQVTSLDLLPTITDSANDVDSGVRFGPTVRGGLPAVLRSVHKGDALRYDSHRAGVVYDGFQISHGIDYWFAFAIQLGAEWVAASSGGAGDRQSLFQTCSAAASPGAWDGSLAEITWEGGLADAGTGKELWLSVPRYDGGGRVYLYSWNANPGGWQRLLLHYRSGSAAQGPVMDVWMANGASAYTKLAKTTDPFTGMTWTVTPAWGDPLTNTLPQFDYVKAEISKWTYGVYGAIPIRTVWMSDVFGASGASLYSEAAFAVAPYAR